MDSRERVNENRSICCELCRVYTTLFGKTVIDKFIFEKSFLGNINERILRVVISTKVRELVVKTSVISVLKNCLAANLERCDFVHGKRSGRFPRNSEVSLNCLAGALNVVTLE